MLNRTLTCIPTPKRINPRPSLSLSLEGINSSKNKWLQAAIKECLTTTKIKRGKSKTNTKGVVRIYGIDGDPNVIVIQVRMVNGLYHVAGRVHLILQELLGEELELDRAALRPNTSHRSAAVSRKVEEIHKKPVRL